MKRMVARVTLRPAVVIGPPPVVYTQEMHIKYGNLACPFCNYVQALHSFIVTESVKVTISPIFSTQCVWITGCVQVSGVRVR